MNGSQFSPEDEIARGDEAARLLETPIFREACGHIESQLTQLREKCPVGDTDMMVRLVLTEQLWNRLQNYLRALMESGDFQKQQLRLRESSVDRMANAVKYGLRNLGVYL